MKPQRLIVMVVFAAAILTAWGARAELSPAQRAQPHVDAGQAAFDDGRYDEALREFRAARALGDEPTLTYNIALCLERRGELREAIDEYNRYLRIAPDARNADEVREHIEELHRRRVEERDRQLQVEAADEGGSGERWTGGTLTDPDTHHEIDLLVGTTVNFVGVRANPGGAALSAAVSYHYRITPSWHLGAAALFDKFFQAEDITTGDTDQSHYGVMVSGRYARDWLDGRLEVRALVGLGYQFLKRDRGGDRHWFFLRGGGSVAWAFWQGLGLQLDAALRLGGLAGGATDEPHVGLSLDILLGLFIAF